MEFRIGDKTINDNNLYFIVEEGQANQGDLNIARKMIELAKDTGADAIEFQLAIADDFYISSHPVYERYKKIELPLQHMKNIIHYAHECKIDFIAASLSHNLIKYLVDFGCDAFNINASDINNPFIVDEVCKSELPFFVSLPLANESEIDWINNRIEKRNVNNFTFLHGQHSMASGVDGVMPEHTSLGYIKTLKNRYKKPVGYIDHTPDIWMPACAVASGANIISKHLIIDRELKGPDWRICLEPNEMKEAINNARKINKSISTVDKILAPGENIDISIMRRSIVFKRDLPKGSEISIEDIEFKRPGTGIAPSEYDSILGKRLSESVVKDDILLMNNLY